MMKITYGNLLGIITDIQTRFSKKGKEYRLYYDGFNVQLQPFIYSVENPFLGAKITFTKDKLSLIVRKIMDKKPEVVEKMLNNGENRLDSKQLGYLVGDLILYCMQNRNIQLDKAIIEERRGINETYNKPFFEIDFEKEKVYNNYQLSKDNGGDPEYIRNLLNELFLNDQETLIFVYDFIYQFITEYRTAAKVTIILKGGRGLGKNVFIDILSSFFDGNLARKYDNSRFNAERLNAKIVFKDESEETKESSRNFKDLEKAAKESSGSEWIEIEQKGKDKILAKSTYYLIILSNNDTVMTISEKPKDEKNNQFFVWDFQNETTPLNERIHKNYPDMEFYQGSGLIKKNARAFLDKYILYNTDIKESPVLRFNNYKGCRYGFPVPITKAELELAEDTKTKADRSFEMLIELAVNGNLEDSNYDNFFIQKLITEPKKGMVFILTSVLNASAKNNKELETTLNTKAVSKYCQKYEIEHFKNKVRRVRLAGQLVSNTVRGIEINFEDLRKNFSYLEFPDIIEEAVI